MDAVAAPTNLQHSTANDDPILTQIQTQTDITTREALAHKTRLTEARVQVSRYRALSCVRVARPISALQLHLCTFAFVLALEPDALVVARNVLIELDKLWPRRKTRPKRQQSELQECKRTRVQLSNCRIVGLSNVRTFELSAL